MSGCAVDESVRHFTISNDLFKLFYAVPWWPDARSIRKVFLWQCGYIKFHQ